MQRTVKKCVSIEGLGLHTGALVTMSVLPAAQNTGIIFIRTDLPGRPEIKASPQAVFDTTLATRIGSPAVFISTIEHCRAAAFGLGIDNAYIEVNNLELPILDGSSLPFLVALDEAGIEELSAPRSYLHIQQPLEINDPKSPERFLRIEPMRGSIPQITYSIDFSSSKTIGRQALTLPFTSEAFCREFSFARTFCLLEEVEFMKARGLARGGSLENAIVVSKEQGVMNVNGLRDETEFVRHKILDCIGDLFLTGRFVVGDVYANKAGHDLHTQLAKLIVDSIGTKAVRVISAGPSNKEVRKIQHGISRARPLGEILTLRGPRLVTG